MSRLALVRKSLAGASDELRLVASRPELSDGFGHDGAPSRDVERDQRVDGVYVGELEAPEQDGLGPAAVMGSEALDQRDVVWLPVCRKTKRGRAVKGQVRRGRWARLGGRSWRHKGSQTCQLVIFGSQDAGVDGLVQVGGRSGAFFRGIDVRRGSRAGQAAMGSCGAG